MVKTGKTLKMTVGWRDGRKWRSWIDSIVGATERRFMRVKTKQLFKNLITIIWEFRASVRWVASVSGNTYTTQIIMSCFSKCGCKSILRNKNEGNRHSTAGVTNQRNPTLLVNISHRRRASGNITLITVITQTCYLGVEECEGMNELSGIAHRSPPSPRTRLWLADNNNEQFTHILCIWANAVPRVSALSLTICTLVMTPNMLCSPDRKGREDGGREGGKSGGLSYS